MKSNLSSSEFIHHCKIVSNYYIINKTVFPEIKQCIKVIQKRNIIKDIVPDSTIIYEMKNTLERTKISNKQFTKIKD